MKLSIDKKVYMVDQVVALDLPMRKVARRLYEAAFKAISKPLCFAAAEKIATETSRGDAAFIITGFPIVQKNLWETDGPLGAAVLAETFRAAGLKPLLITDEGCIGILRYLNPAFKVLGFPVENEKAQLEAEKLISRLNPSVLVAIERPGWNEKRRYHNMKGGNISDWVGKTDYLFLHSCKTGIATIAVADGGNELGCGTIVEAVRKYVPHGSRCQCPCGGGIASVTPADVLVISGVSNWGSYGIAACFSLMKKVRFSHNAERELQLLERAVKAGAIDSITLEGKPFVDGVPPSVNGLIANLLLAIINT